RQIDHRLGNSVDGDRSATVFAGANGGGAATVDAAGQTMAAPPPRHAGEMSADRPPSGTDRGRSTTVRHNRGRSTTVRHRPRRIDHRQAQTAADRPPSTGGRPGGARPVRDCHYFREVVAQAAHEGTTSAKSWLKPRTKAPLPRSRGSSRARRHHFRGVVVKTNQEGPASAKPQLPTWSAGSGGSGPAATAAAGRATSGWEAA